RSPRRRPRPRLLLLEDNILGAFPHHNPAKFPKLLPALYDRQKVVPSQLAHLAGEHRIPVGEQDLGLAVPARIEQYLAGRWTVGVILESYADLEVAERDPGSLSTPARLNDLVPERQQPLKRGTG